MGKYQIISNPDLTVGKNNKQRWNQANHRRHGFHNAHRLFRRALMVRSRDVLVLGSHPNIAIQNHPKLKPFSGLGQNLKIMLSPRRELTFRDSSHSKIIPFSDPFSMPAASRPEPLFFQLLIEKDEPEGTQNQSKNQPKTELKMNP